MDDKDIPLNLALADYKDILGKIEPVLNEWQSVLDRLPPNDPVHMLLTRYLRRWEKFRSWADRGADEDYQGLFQEIEEIGNWLPGMATTRPPFAAQYNEEMGQVHRDAGFSQEEVSQIMTQTNKGGRYAPRSQRETAIEAYRLWTQQKSYGQIADKLCSCGQTHEHRLRGEFGERQLSPCADRFRDLIRQLKSVLQKYPR